MTKQVAEERARTWSTDVLHADLGIPLLFPSFVVNSFFFFFVKHICLNGNPKGNESANHDRKPLALSPSLSLLVLCVCEEKGFALCTKVHN